MPFASHVGLASKLKIRKQMNEALGKGDLDLAEKYRKQLQELNKKTNK